MGELPPLDSIAAALVLVGFLFALRYWLALRRLRAGAPQAAPHAAQHVVWKAPQAGVYGETMEPNRRYAARQYWQAAIFLVAGLCLAAWIVLTGYPITIGAGT